MRGGEGKREEVRGGEGTAIWVSAARKLIIMDNEGRGGRARRLQPEGRGEGRGSEGREGEDKCRDGGE